MKQLFIASSKSLMGIQRDRNLIGFKTEILDQAAEFLDTGHGKCQKCKGFEKSIVQIHRRATKLNYKTLPLN